MDVFIYCLRFLHLIGIHRRQPKEPKWRSNTKRTLHFVFGLWTIVPQIIYIIDERTSFINVACALYTTSMFGGIFVHFIVMLWHQDSILKCIAESRRFVDKRIWANDSRVFETAEQRVTKLSRWFHNATTVSTFGFLVIPIILLAKAKLINSVTSSTFQAPFHDYYYFFDTNESPLFEIFYLLYMIAVYFIVNIFLTKNFVFFAVCIYVVAMYDELKLELHKIDRARPAERLRTIRECARIHVGLLQIIKLSNDFLKFMLFVQFVYSLFTLASLVFAANYVEFEQVAALAVNASCLFGELFIFCFGGSLILDKANQVNWTIYNLRWYEYSREEKIMLQIMLTRNCVPAGFYALDYIECNLLTFQYIMNKVFSAFTFMRSMAL